MAGGHHPEDIWGYTIRAVQAYVDLVVRRQRQQLHDWTIAIRHTQGTDAKVFREFLTGLQGDE